jgi:S-adenosylmethionine synthetase
LQVVSDHIFVFSKKRMPIFQGFPGPTSRFLASSGQVRKISNVKIAECIKQVFDLRPAAIIRTLDLLRPIYLQTAAYGHFGRPDLDLPWERLDKAEELRKLAGM